MDGYLAFESENRKWKVQIESKLGSDMGWIQQASATLYPCDAAGMRRPHSSARSRNSSGRYSGTCVKCEPAAHSGFCTHPRTCSCITVPKSVLQL